MKSISPFLEKCDNYCPLIEKHGHGVAISQMGENTLGYFFFSFPFVDGMHGDHDRRLRGIRLTAGQVLPEQRSCQERQTHTFHSRISRLVLRFFYQIRIFFIPSCSVEFRYQHNFFIQELALNFKLKVLILNKGEKFYHFCSETEIHNKVELVTIACELSDKRCLDEHCSLNSA